ncbi:MAG TPA: hypothetical protein DD381_01200 [Lentisphaeria bacterium]|nr:MAG: hypothetical protein A2X47_13460 [Lentisphaerae bacterium GWF2_38_69]HBM14960.1 hypothetical protein [Lentisphaeria bacterium]
MIKAYMKLSLSKKIYISTAIGFFIGLFFGDRCAVLEPLNIAFIKIFQIMIVPYMIFSIIKSIGSLNSENTKIIIKYFVSVLIILWMLSIFYAFLLGGTFPNIDRGDFFHIQSPLNVNANDLYDLFIPSNPFFSLANGYIPAIVAFSILVGIAIVRSAHKEAIIKFATVCEDLMSQANKYILALLPFGVLIMSIYTLGTLNAMKLKGVLLYISSAFFYIIFMSVFIYPLLISAVSRVKIKQFFHYAMPSAVIAFSTGSVFLALPVIYQSMYKFDESIKGKLDSSDGDPAKKTKARNMVSIIVPLAWVFPATYKFMVIYFIIYEQWYFNRALDIFHQISIFFGGIPCLFGNNAVIVPFLLNLFNLPNKAYDIFMLTSRFMVYFNNANGAMFIILCTMLCLIAISGRIRINWVRLTFFFIISLVIFLTFVGTLNKIMTKFLSGNNEIREELTHMNINPHNILNYQTIKAEYLTADQYRFVKPLSKNEPLLNRIVRSNALKVGYNPYAAPLSFFNIYGVLVGFDVDFVYDLAQGLGCENIEFYPVSNIEEIETYMQAGKILDICIGGWLYTGEVHGSMVSSEPNLPCIPAIVLPDKYKNKFKTIDQVLSDKSISLGLIKKEIFGGSAFMSKILNGRKIVFLNNYNDFFLNQKSDVLISSAAKAGPQCILNPGFSYLYYKGEAIKLFYSYLIPYSGHSATFREYVNTWILIYFRTGMYEQKYNYWIMGKTNITLGKSWSILDWLINNKYFVTSNTLPDNENLPPH